ncbi:MAG: succinate dehydrogenase assembly factor 2 [Rhodobacteraceae bacterium]|nr:succinate dehydrogenase assembly factor 2 [Paracoccaceae bacterium]
MTENPQHRLKRLAMRSMRRGIKEMDLILSDFAGAALARLTPAELDLYEELLEENDHDIYLWVSGQDAGPSQYTALVAKIAVRAQGLTRPV